MYFPYQRISLRIRTSYRDQIICKELFSSSCKYIMAKQTSPLSKRSVAILQGLRYLNKNQRISLLKKANAILIRSICECVLNISCRNISIKRENKIKLRKYIKILRKLCKPEETLQNEKKIIFQQGGFIGPVLSVLAPLLVSLLK